MCIKSSSSTQELSPGSSHQEQQPQPSSPSPSKSAACKAVGKALQGKATHSYQNVTCNAETSLFQLEEKKASSSVTTTASTVEVKEADTNKTHASNTEIFLGSCVRLRSQQNLRLLIRTKIWSHFILVEGV